MRRRDHLDSLERLLGPRGDELGCDECFDVLDEFVELELAGIDAERQIAGMRAHLEGCSACRDEHDALYELAMGEVGSD